MTTTIEKERSTILRGTEEFTNALKSFLAPLVPVHVGAFEVVDFNNRFSLELVQETRIIDSGIIGRVYDQAHAFQRGYNAAMQQKEGLNNA